MNMLKKHCYIEKGEEQEKQYEADRNKLNRYKGKVLHLV